MLAARDNGMLLKYGIDIAKLQKGISYIIVEDKIVVEG